MYSYIYIHLLLYVWVGFAFLALRAGVLGSSLRPFQEGSYEWGRVQCTEALSGFYKISGLVMV